MSLIEQAARRLEQLREAGAQVSGDLSVAAEPQDAQRLHEEEATMIERATERMRGLQIGHAAEASVDRGRPVEGGRAETAAPTHEVAAGEPPILPEEAPPAMASIAEPARAAPQTESKASVARQEQRAVPRSGGELRPSSGRRSRVVEIDFNRMLERGLLTPNTAQSRLANELRVIKRPIINNCVGKAAVAVRNARRVMVTSALPGEGKSFISMNLALSIAMEKDSTVLLVEGDPTRPALAEMLGIPPARGLMDLLVDHRLDVADVMIRTNLGRLSFIPAGTRQENATELLASTVMGDLVEQLYERYADRIIIFDSPPLLAAPEPRVLAQHMGQIVYVIEAEQTAQSTVQEAISTIEACPVVMAVLNKSSFREEGYYYSYYYSQQE